MLLVFDEVTFVDPVEDAEWRAKLFEDLESHDAEFAFYQGIDQALPELVRQGCVKRFDPGPGVDARALATASALSDLNDQDWLRVASNPQKHGMPSSLCLNPLVFSRGPNTRICLCQSENKVERAEEVRR